MSDAVAHGILLESLKHRLSERSTKQTHEAGEIDASSYHVWIRRFDTLNARDRETIRQHIASEGFPDLLVAMIFNAASAEFAPAAMKHLRAQLLERFDALLCFASDCPRGAITLARRAAKGDSRFSIACVSDFDTIAAEIARHENLFLAEGGVLLREHALYAFVACAQEHASSIVYSDQDYLDRNGVRLRPYFKPRFSPELLRRTGYAGPCVLLRGIDLDVRKLSANLKRTGTAERYIEELMHQMGKVSMIHIPLILYHDARENRPRRRLQGELCLSDQNLPTVSVIILTKDRLDLLAACLDSVRNLTFYPPDKFEIVVVDNGSENADALHYLKEANESGAIVLLRDARAFNYARLNNLAARQTTAEVLVFLNNDTLVDDPRWLRFLVSQAIQKDVGAVGPKLLYPNRTVQSGGSVLSSHGTKHAHVGLGENAGGYRDLANTTREVSAVTGACLAIRRKVFEEIGGFDANLAVEFSDVLLCLEASARHYRNLYLALPLLIHLESKTRGLIENSESHDRRVRETSYALSRHRELFQSDPFYNPNLSYDPIYDIAVPPRRRKPWHVHGRGIHRVLLLSNVHDELHGLFETTSRQASHLQRLGYEVFIGGPRKPQERPCPGCDRVYLTNASDAAAYAVAKDINTVIANSSPFYSVLRWIGDWPKLILCDHGEPDAGYSTNPELRCEERVEKRFCLAIAERVVTSSAVADPKMETEDALAELAAMVGP